MMLVKLCFSEVWKLESDYLDNDCRNRFRTPLDLSHWLMRYWNFATGNFEPIDNIWFSGYISFNGSDENIEMTCRTIRSKEKAILVINDAIPDSRSDKFEEYKKKLQAAFEEILPEKSGFEL